MATLIKRIVGSALVGLCALALALTPAGAQGDKDKIDKEKEKDKDGNPFIRLPAATGAPGGGAAAPAAPKGGAGFTSPVPGEAGGPPINPYSQLLNNPYGVGIMSSKSVSGGNVDIGGGWGGYGYQMPDPYGGYLKGAASVISAQGQFVKDLQSSFLTREAVRRAQLDNSRALFDDWLYRRANTPTLEDEREKTMREDIRRAKNEPPPTEIWSGLALNNLLVNAQKVYAKKGQAPSVAIDEEVLRKINVTSGKNGSNLGVFKNEGNLAWPLALRELEDAEAVRRSLDEYARKAYKEALKGYVDTGTLKEMTALSNQLHNLLLRNVNKVPFSQYSEAKRFLNQLDDGIKAFRQADVLNFVNGKYNLKGTTIADVVKHMSENGLVFAPATPGDEAAYRALQLALAAYDTELARDR